MNQPSRLDEVADEFLDEQRVPVGVRLDDGVEFFGDRGRSEQLTSHRPAVLDRQAGQRDAAGVGLSEDRLDHGCTAGSAQAVQRDLGVIGDLPPRVQVFRPVHEHDQQRRVGHGVHDEGQDVLGGLVDPVHVLQHQGQRALGGAG